MSRHVHVENEFGAGVDEVFALLSGPAWAERRGAALRDGSQVVRREEAPDGGVTVVVSRELPDGVPGFLERFLPQDGRVTQTDAWRAPERGSRPGAWRVDLPGAPARLGGTMRLEPTAAGCRYVIDGEIEVKVPLVGGRAESFVAGKVERLADKEAEVLRSALAGPPDRP